MRLADIETYYDTVPRAVSRHEEVGPFTLFVADPSTGWQFYARPRLGLTTEITSDDVRRVLARQVELGVPRAVEWVDEVTPSLLSAVREVLVEGQDVDLCPLLVLPAGTALEDVSGRTRVLDADDPDLPLFVGAVSAGFGERDEVVAGDVGRRPELVRQGVQVLVAGYDASGRVVGGGSAAPRGHTAELTGISVLPSARRQGLGSALTAALVGACRVLGVEVTFLSAGSDGAASIYRHLGFEQVGTACVLEIDD